MYSAYNIVKHQELSAMFNSKKRFILILIGSFLSQIVQVGIFPLFLAQKLAVADVSLSVIGWFLALQWVAVLGIAPLVPAISRKIGLVNINKASGVQTLLGLLCLTSDDLALAMCASALVGSGLILRWIACDTLIVKLSTPTKVGRLIGAHETLMGFGIAVGPLLFTVFVLDQIFYAAVIIILFSSLAFFLNVNQFRTAEDRQNTSFKKSDFLFYKITFLIALVGGFIETAAVALFPFYFAFDGFSLQQSAWFISAFGLGGTILQLPLGFLVDRIGYGNAQLAACSAGILAILGLFISPSSFVTVYSILFIFGGAVGAFNTLAVIQAGSQVSENKSASAMTYIAMSYTVGSIFGPIITANILSAFSGDMLLLIYAVLIVFMAGFIAKEVNI